jgi:hypothetical protein
MAPNLPGTKLGWLVRLAPYHFKGEHVHKSKKMNKIMFVWNVRKWKPILVDASETTEDDVTT